MSRSSLCPAAFPASGSPPPGRLSPREMPKKLFRTFRLPACCYPPPIFGKTLQLTPVEVTTAQPGAPRLLHRRLSRPFEHQTADSTGNKVASISNRDPGSIGIAWNLPDKPCGLAGNRVQALPRIKTAPALTSARRPSVISPANGRGSRSPRGFVRARTRRPHTHSRHTQALPGSSNAYPRQAFPACRAP